jgi:hypothetical protein
MRRFLKYTSAFLFSLFLLSACNNNANESPETVMEKAQEKLVEIESGQIEVVMNISDETAQDAVGFKGEISAQFDHSDEELKKTEVSGDLSGSFQAEGQTLDGRTSFDFISIGQQLYVKLNDLETNYPDFQQIAPFVNMYQDKWLSIAEDFIPEEIRELSAQDEEMRKKQEQLEDLFEETELFNVIKEYGVETLNGKNVYHFGVEADEDGFREYVSKAAAIHEQPLTNDEVDEAVEVITYLNEAELWIGTNDYYVYKAVLNFSGDAVAENGADMSVTVTIEGEEFNKRQEIEAPEGAEEFNPLNLLLGGGAASQVQLDAEGVSEQEIELDVMLEDEEESDVEITVDGDEAVMELDLESGAETDAADGN